MEGKKEATHSEVKDARGCCIKCLQGMNSLKCQLCLASQTHIVVGAECRRCRRGLPEALVPALCPPLSCMHTHLLMTLLPFLLIHSSLPKLLKGVHDIADIGTIQEGMYECWGYNTARWGAPLLDGLACMHLRHASSVLKVTKAHTQRRWLASNLALRMASCT